MWYWTVRAIATFILRVFFRFKVEGLENLPQKTNYIIVANHASFMDCFVIVAAIPKKVNFIAHRDLYQVGWLRWLLPKLGVLPTGTSSEKAIDSILQNKIVALFPEGTCTRDGTLREFRRGAALLAIKTGRPILPCAILGTFESLPVTSSFPKLAPIKIRINKPTYLLREFDTLIDDAYLQEGILKIRNMVKEMCYAK